MTSTRRTRIGRALAGLATALTVAGLLVTPIHGQDHEPEDWKGVAQLVVEGRFQGGEPGDVVVWRSGRFADGLIVPLDVASARRELARLEADALIDRAWTPALEALLALRTRAVFSNDDADARLELLVDMARTEIGWCLDLGNTSAAHSATRHLLLGEAPESVLDAERVDELNELARRFLAHPEIVALRASLAERLPSIEPGLEKTVREAVADDDTQTLDQLGSRALPVLDMLARSETAAPGDTSHDPLFSMLRLDAGRGIDLMRELLESGDVLPLRALALLDAWNGWGLPEFWAVRQPRPPRLRDTDLLRVLELCFEQPAPTTSVANLHWGAVNDVLRRFATLDALTPELARILGRHLAEATELPDWVVRNLVRQKERRPSWFPVLEALLAHPADGVRAMAAEALADFPRSDALRARVADDEPRVRRALARSLQQRDVREATFGGPQQAPNSTTRPLGPEIGEPERAILRELARDVDSEVRVEAARAITALAEPLEPRVYSALADDVLGEVRLVMAWLVHPDAAVLGDVLRRLAGDPDPAVRLAVAQRRDAGEVGPIVGEALVVLSGDPDPSVREVAAEGLVTQAAFGVSTDDALALLDDPDPHVRASVVYQASAYVVDLGALVRRAVEDPDPGVLAAVDWRLDQALDDGTWTAWARNVMTCLERRLPSYAESGRSLPWSLDRLGSTAEGARVLVLWALRFDHPAVWGAAVRADADGRRAWLGLEISVFSKWWQALDVRAPDVLARFASDVRKAGSGIPRVRRLLVDEEHSADSRAAALMLTTHDLGPDELQLVLDTLLALEGEQTLSEAAQAYLARAAAELPPDVVNTLILSLFVRLDDCDDVPPAFWPFLEQYAPDREFGERITTEVLVRWYRPDGRALPVVQRAVRALGRHPGAAADGLLTGALRSPYALEALDAMAVLRDPAHLELLGECLTPDWSHEGIDDIELIDHAKSALVAHMSDAAVEVLLAGAARSSQANRRGLIMDGVSQIQEFQEAQSEWQRRQLQGQGRDGAVLELLELLGHDEPLVRVEAARGLATLGAVDQLPRLIRVLADDPSADVRAAAKVALDQLNLAAAGLDASAAQASDEPTESAEG